MTRLVTRAPFAALSAFSRCSRPLKSFSLISFTVFLCFLFVAVWPQSISGNIGPLATSPAKQVLTEPSLPVVVCNVGTGINRNHPELRNKIWENELEINGDADVDDDDNGYVDDFYGFDSIESNGDPTDDVGLGTHVAGTIAGLNNESTAFTNWSPKIMSCRFMSRAGGSKRRAVECMQYCRANKATVVIFPFVTWSMGSDFAEELNKLDTEDIPVISPAGDSRSDLDATAALVKPKNLIVVSSVDQDNNLSAFSNYGNKTVTLGAPGQNQNSTFDSGYVSVSGTAMAAAHVTRAVALLYGIQSKRLTAVLDILRSTVTLSDDLRDKTLWGGVVDEDEAVAVSSKEAMDSLSTPVGWDSLSTPVASSESPPPPSLSLIKEPYWSWSRPYTPGHHIPA